MVFFKDNPLLVPISLKRGNGHDIWAERGVKNANDPRNKTCTRIRHFRVKAFNTV